MDNKKKEMKPLQKWTNSPDEDKAATAKNAAAKKPLSAKGKKPDGRLGQAGKPQGKPMGKKGKK